MTQAVMALIENPGATKIVFNQKHTFEYDYSQVKLLAEVASVYKRLVAEKRLLGYEHLIGSLQTKGGASRYQELRTTLLELLKKDPIGCYVELLRVHRREKIAYEHEQDPATIKLISNYLEILETILGELKATELITRARPYLAGMTVGDREPYRKLFNPFIKPDFMFTRYLATYPLDAEEVESYQVGSTEVVVFALKGSIQKLYHITPPEFRLSEEKYEILDMARKIMSEHKPKEEDFVNPNRMREVFSNVGRDLIGELAQSKEVNLTEEEITELTSILVRYTVGFGLIEVLLEDELIQDITVNSPMGESPIFVVHAKYDECKTNILPSVLDAESWATKLRLMSGRPLDEANPILDTEIEVPGVARARVGVIGRPLDPTGIAYAFRRHRDKPWTLALFVKNRMITSLAAGLLSFLIDGNRTFLVAGTRSAGKSSLLGAVMVEIMRKYRIISIEDTLELPTDALRTLGYNIQPMKVASALSKTSSEVPADEGIRTTLRLGDSALFVGEVRSTEAQALYEAMRVGALANVVAGTIHGDSPYGVFDRVVNDLRVPRTSFKATDIIVVANPIRSADGLSRFRRVTRITEVRKEWEDDPERESGFVDLMKYDPRTDQLEPTDALINGDSDIVKAIAGNVKEWAGKWDLVWENIVLRGKIKQALVDMSTANNLPELLEATFVISANDKFHQLVEKEKSPEKIFLAFTDWLAKQVKRYIEKNA
ncbi:MAG: type II/IV secretion system ATPase subunit [Candidatus Woesearchaeota archaeon]|nr:MAG: type II/IV secretion system ATPase subunit [Candidatus Woesearchaeota archaeon]